MRTAARLFATLAVFGAPALGAAQGAGEDVKVAVAGIYAAINAANPDALVEYMATGGYTEITATGRRVKIDEAYVRQVFRSGLRVLFDATELEVRLFGDVALVTGYRVGGPLMDGSGPPRERFALSMVWVRERGWKLSHVHLSPTADTSRP